MKSTATITQKQSQKKITPQITDTNTITSNQTTYKEEEITLQMVGKIKIDNDICLDAMSHFS